MNLRVYSAITSSIDACFRTCVFSLSLSLFLSLLRRNPALKVRTRPFLKDRPLQLKRLAARRMRPDAATSRVRRVVGKNASLFPQSTKGQHNSSAQASEEEEGTLKIRSLPLSLSRALMATISSSFFALNDMSVSCTEPRTRVIAVKSALPPEDSASQNLRVAWRVTRDVSTRACALARAPSSKERERERDRHCPRATKLLELRP